MILLQTIKLATIYTCCSHLFTFNPYVKKKNLLVRYLGQVFFSLCELQTFSYCPGCGLPGVMKKRCRTRGWIMRGNWRTVQGTRRMCTEEEVWNSWSFKLLCRIFFEIYVKTNLTEFIFSTLTTVLKIYKTLPITVCEVERNFSKWSIPTPFPQVMTLLQQLSPFLPPSSISPTLLATHINLKHTVLLPILRTLFLT